MTLAAPMQSLPQDSSRVEGNDGTQKAQPDVAASEADIDDFLDEMLSSLSAKDRKAVYASAGKEIARSVGAQIMRLILTNGGMSLRQLEKESGFDPASLSRIATGSTKSGPALWTLFAVADALGCTLDFSVQKK